MPSRARHLGLRHPDALYDLGAGAAEERLDYFEKHPARRQAVAADLQRAAVRYQPAVVVRGMADVSDAM